MECLILPDLVFGVKQKGCLWKWTKLESEKFLLADNGSRTAWSEFLPEISLIHLANPQWKAFLILALKLPRTR